jgi:rhamnose utilization protein RhaD (predicted bifunctional aldolase and dehydrogenase)
MSILEEITRLSHLFGTDHYVKAGGGNTSCKTADTLWVKPSGTTLSGLAPDTFVKMSRPKMALLYTAKTPSDPAAREALVKDMMAAAVAPESAGKRASVEAALHDSLSATFVVHTHPAWVNGLTCAVCGKAAAARLFPDALWLPYTDPGYTLCMAVRAAVAKYRSAHGGKEPSVIFLANHGVFVSADTADGITALYKALDDTLTKAYAKAGVYRDALPTGVIAAMDARLAEMAALIQRALGEDAAYVAPARRYDFAEGPITPDHVVYTKSFIYNGALTLQNLRAWRDARGYAPRVLDLPECAFMAGRTEKAAKLAFELATDGALVKQCARAFGGIQYMSDASRLFIENWEVESYRAKQQA